MSHRPERRGLQASVRGEPPLRRRALPRGGHAQRPLPGPGLRGPRPPHGPLDALRRGALPLPGPDGLLPVRRVPPGSPPRQQPPQPGECWRGAAGDRRSWAWTSTPSSTRRRSPAWETEAWAASPPATWTRWPLSRCRPSATGSATSSGSSTRSSATGGRWRSPTSGCTSATPGRSRDPEIAFEVGLGGHDRVVRGRGRPRASALDPRARGPGRGLRHPDPRLPGGQRQPAAPLAGGGHRVLRLPGLQRGRLLGRGRGEGPLRDDQQGPLPERRAGGRAAPAPGPAVLLRLLLAAGHDPHPPPDRLRRAGARRRGTRLSSTTPTPRWRSPS